MDTKNTINTLSQSLLDEVKKIMKKEKEESKADEKREHCSEELKGNQHKIDANKNGKIDAHDFKLLRKKKGVAEVYAALKNGEEISEEDADQIDEAGPVHVATYGKHPVKGSNPPQKYNQVHLWKHKDGQVTVNRASHHAGDALNGYKNEDEAHKAITKMGFHKVNEEVQIDELSRKTMASYVKKAVPDMRGLEDASDRHHQKGHDTYKAGATKTSDKHFNLSARHLRKSEKRGEGINTALNKLAKEEVEDLDESNPRSDRYLGTVSKSDPDYEKKVSDLKKQASGGSRVRGRLGKDNPNSHLYATGGPLKRVTAQDIKPEHSSRVDVYSRKPKMTKEDVELTQEEIERLDTMMAEIDEARGRPPKEGSDAWKRQQAAGGSEQDEPRQHPIQQLERIKRDMRGGDVFKHKNGETSKLTGSHASKLLDKYHGLKPAGKEDMQKEIHSSAAGLKKHM